MEKESQEKPEEKEQKTKEEQAEPAPAEPIEAAEIREEIPEEISEKEEEKEEAVEETAESEEKALAPSEEEVKLPSREEKAEEEEIVEERIYTIPLGRAWIMPPRKRAARAMRMVRSFIVKHMKLEARKEGEEEEEEPKQLVITNEVNEKVWGRGIEKPPRKVRVRAAKDKEGNITVYLAEGD
jgi:large subunit ribosomal protein L31e